MVSDQRRFIVPDKWNTPFAIAEVGTDYCDKSYRKVRVNPTVNVIEYIVSGKGTLELPSGVYHPTAGDSYLLRGGIPHEYYSDANDPWVKIWVNFYGTLPRSIMDSYGIHESIFLPKLDTSVYIKQLHSIAIANENNATSRNNQGSTVFLQLCQFILQNLTTLNEPASIPENIVKLKNYIDLHLDKPLSLEECNAITYLSTSQTIRSFRRAYGVAPYEYLNSQRIISAQILLRSTSLSIHDIALKLGFQDQNYFSKYFKKKCGQSPKQYREYQTKKSTEVKLP